jgi:hypothetical protein
LFYRSPRVRVIKPNVLYWCMHSSSSGCSARTRSASHLFLALCRPLKIFASHSPTGFWAPSTDQVVSQRGQLMYHTRLLASQSPRLATWRDFCGSIRATSAVVPVLARIICTYEFPVSGSLMMLLISSSVSLEICLGPPGKKLTKSVLMRSSMPEMHRTNIFSMVDFKTVSVEPTADSREALIMTGRVSITKSTASWPAP